MKYLLTSFLLLTTVVIYAQQMPAFANSYANRMIYNPANAYSEASQLDVMVLNRNQWVGLEGAPSIQLLQIQFGIPESNIGIGGHLLHDQAGPFSVTRLSANFSYKIAMDETQYLVVGLSGSMSRNQLGLSDLDLIENQDQLFAKDIASGTNANFGMGIHFRAQAWSFDLSVPRLLKNKLFSSQALSEDDNSREVKHFFFATRFEQKISETLTIKPSVALRAVAQAPISLDISANVVVRDKFEIAPFLRVRESLGVQASYFITEQLYAGYSYEVGTSKLRTYNSGSHEFFLGFRQALKKPKAEIKK